MQCTRFGVGSIEPRCGRAAVEHLGRLQWSLDRSLSKPAETSHGPSNHHLHAHRLLGHYSPRPSWGFPSRPQRRACGKLSGWRPLASQYASPEPIRCILNASSADRPAVAAPFLGSSRVPIRRVCVCKPSLGRTGRDWIWGRTRQRSRVVQAISADGPRHRTPAPVLRRLLS